MSSEDCQNKRIFNFHWKISKDGKKGKVHHTPLQSVGGCSSPSPRPWARRWRTHCLWRVASAMPDLCYLPSHKASPPIGWYQIILLGDRGTCVLTTCPGLHSTAERLGFEPATCWSQVQRPNHLTTETHCKLDTQIQRWCTCNIFRLNRIILKQLHYITLHYCV